MVSEDSGGMTPIGKVLHDINELIFVKNKKPTSVVVTVLVLVLTFAVFKAEASDKSDKMLTRDGILAIIRSAGEPGADFSIISDYVEIRTKFNMGRELSQGETDSGTVENGPGKVLLSMGYSWTWQDETSPPGIPKLRRYTNEPDTFRVRVVDPLGNITSDKSSDSGSISDSMEFSEEQMRSYFGKGNFTIEVSLEETGEWVPVIGPGIITYRDDQNSYTLVIDMVHLQPEEA